MDYGTTSLLPPLIAIVLALLTHRVLLPLAAGILVGAALLADTSAESGGVVSTGTIFFVRLWESVRDPDHLLVFAFTILLGMMVGVIEAAGSMRRAIFRLATRVRDRRGVQTLIAVSGLAVFFDDYANTLLVGGTMRSTADRFGISRAKLAYLVDSTAAPVAGLALVSTWVATELSYLQSGIDASHYGQSADGTPPIRVFDFFLQSIPYRFYPWFALAMVFIIARTGRDFGPMRVAEENAIQARRENPDEVSESNEAVLESKSALGDVVEALLPIVVCLTAVLVTLVVTGRAVLAESPVASDVATSSSWLGALKQAGDIVGSGNSYWALVIGGGCGLATATFLAGSVSPIGIGRLARGWFDGAMQMMPAMAVLWLAWALSSMTGKDSLDTGGYLSSLLSDRIDIRLLPTCVFVLAGAIAFATGTSWGTMAIVTPIAVSLVLDMQADASPLIAANSPIALATFSGVLAGAIFGDHCSPISDTTVLSSRACGCDHVLHVKTQMPYALLAGGVCIVTGTLPVAFGVPVWVCFAAGIVSLLLITRWLGVRPGAETTVNDE